jgi:tetratricopeptide (TPR) repeat protein
MVALEAQARIALGQLAPALRMVDSAVGSEIAYGDVQIALLATYTAATELAAHGYPAEAKAVAALAVDRAVARLGSEPADSEIDLRSILLDVAYRAERWDQAGAVADSLLALDPSNFRALWRLASLAARRGDGAEAERIIGTIAAPKTPSVLAYREVLDPNVTLARSWLAGGAVAAILGDRDEAVRLAGRALANGAYGSFDLMHREKDFEPLRDYPPFQALLRLKE